MRRRIGGTVALDVVREDPNAASLRAARTVWERHAELEAARDGAPAPETLPWGDGRQERPSIERQV